MFGSICHFEIPADDVESLRKCYEGLFGWTIEKVPGDMDYYLINTGQEGIEGGMMARQAPEQTPVNYVLVESVDASMEQAVKLGAQIIVPKMPVPEMGWFVVLMDPQKNPFGLWENDETAQ
jgi:predicted enzyme related to lactoylglutathione lyase